MSSISLVVCLHNEGDLLRRLLGRTRGCFDDLVVVHDGPDTFNIRSVVEGAGGKFYENVREYQQESHWPFAWQQAAHNWILRLDADEFPSVEMKSWLEKFRASNADDSISGYTCVWPLWNGRRTVSRKLPAGRIFLFNRQRVRFFGMNEQVPIADQCYQSLDFILHHQPTRPSYGFRNLLLRKQAYRWRARIGKSLLGKPTDLYCWRWKSGIWPQQWEEIRQKPVRTMFSRLILGTLRTLRDQWRIEHRFYPLAAIHGPIHHALICLEFCKARRQQRREVDADAIKRENISETASRD